MKKACMSPRQQWRLALVTERFYRMIDVIESDPDRAVRMAAGLESSTRCLSRLLQRQRANEANL